MVKKALINPSRISAQNLKLASEEEKAKDLLYEDVGFFFLVVCDGSSADKYFEEVIEKRMKISPPEQHQGLFVGKDMLFQLAIDFCEYFNVRFQGEGRDSPRFAINWLKDMRKHPEKHQIEWDMWNRVVIGVTEHGEKSLGFF